MRSPAAEAQAMDNEFSIPWLRLLSSRLWCARVIVRSQLSGLACFGNFTLILECEAWLGDGSTCVRERHNLGLQGTAQCEDVIINVFEIPGARSKKVHGVDRSPSTGGSSTRKWATNGPQQPPNRPR